MTTVTDTARRTFAGVLRRAEDKVGGAARLKIIVLLAAILALDTGDKATVSAVAGSLKQAFHIGNTDIGILIASVSFMGAALTLPFGSMVDRINRTYVLTGAIALWAAAMVVSGTASSFTYLLVTRIFLGGVTAVASPAVASLTGDFFPARERAKMYGWILSGELIGTGIGFFFAGEISALIDWHWAFYLMAIPSAALAFAIWRYLPEPQRGGQSWIGFGGGERQSTESEQAQRKIRRAGIAPREDLVLTRDPRRRSIWWVIRYLVRIPTYRLLVIASSL
ncbi:MAG: MFS transporter, partial [Pseudolabrys sp.]